MEALSLIDVAAEDDLLLDLASPPPPHPPPLHPDLPRPGFEEVVAAEDSRLEPAGDASEEGRVVDPVGATEEAPEQSESPKQRKGKAGVNLRKSLAWDSAFFTSEGVLDTEELAVVNSTFQKAQGSRLPGIAEEMRRSWESTTSTLESESWVLENLETELFDNVRASIQRSHGNPRKSPVTSVTSKPSKSKTNAPRVAARVDLMPQSKLPTRPPISTSHGVAGGKQRLQDTLKESTATRVALPGSTEVKPSLKPPRALPRVATMRAPANTAMASGIPDKRSSTGGTVSRQAVGKSVNNSASTHSRPGGMTKSVSTSKPGVLPPPPSAAATSIGNMAGQKAKPPALSNKSRTAQRIPVRSTSRTDISKVNPARASRNNIPSRGNSDRISPSISPSSSVDSLSSVVSGASTTSTVGKMSHTSESFSTRSSSLSPLRKSNDHPPIRADAATQGKGSKPSGLRMPTPKIGYFDAEKSVDQHIGAQMPKKIQCSPQRSSAQMGTPAPSTLSQPESRSTPHDTKGSVQSKPSPLLPLEAVQIELEPSQAMQHEVCTPKPGQVVAADTAKENIPALHQNIQPNNDGAG
ncbi:mucin-5AC-like [Oryza brachyantha]|uniref:mucin-5AC-like n=1 Tax=Oryza brachyantha TaxID=4533 RepID=UPI001ADCB3D9|nr:mucin-5AC-like [Oryza brachyantha]